MAVVTHGVLAQALAAGELRDRELNIRRVAGMQGPNRVIIVTSESCADFVIATNSSGQSFGAGAAVLAGRIGLTTNELVLSRPPPGAGSTTAPRSTTINVGPGVPAGRPILGIQYSGGGTTADLDVTLAWRSVPSTTWAALQSFTIARPALPAATNWGRLGASIGHGVTINGDDTLPDGSFAFVTQHTPSSLGSLQVQIVNVLTGDVVEVEAVSGTRASGRLFWHRTEKRLYYAHSFFTADGDRTRIVRFKTDGTSFEVVHNFDSAGARFYGPYGISELAIVAPYSSTQVGSNEAVEGFEHFLHDGSRVDIPALTTVQGDMDQGWPPQAFGIVDTAAGKEGVWLEGASTDSDLRPATFALGNAVDLGWPAGFNNFSSFRVHGSVTAEGEIFVSSLLTRFVDDGMEGVEFYGFVVTPVNTVPSVASIVEIAFEDFNLSNGIEPLAGTDPEGVLPQVSHVLPLPADWAPP